MRRLLLVALLLAACEQRVIVGETPDAGDERENWVDLQFGSRTTDVDLLFVIDNSPSMTPKQTELKLRFSSLIAQLEQFGPAYAGHYHIGVITTDLGAGPFTLSNGQCHPGGDRGLLQALGKAANQDCRGPVGVPYIDLDQTNGVDNLPPGQNLATTFGCMASVGDQGCGFEMPLEAAYQALHDPPPENGGFLRERSIVAVVFITDEDDCSAPPETDLFDPAQIKYGLNSSFRCTQYGVVCGNPPQPLPYGSSEGPLQNCRPAPDGLLYGVDRYVDFFRQLRINPSDVVLFSIAARPTYFSTILANPNNAEGGPYQQCPGPVQQGTCQVTLDHACVSSQKPELSGDPAVRLQALVGMKLSTTGSICDDNYDATMRTLGTTLISSQSGNGCVPGTPPDEHDPRCEVDDLSEQADGSVHATRLPACLDGDGVTPCWRMVPFSACDSGLQLVVDRGSTPPPGAIRARCVVSR